MICYENIVDVAYLFWQKKDQTKKLAKGIQCKDVTNPTIFS